MITCMIVDDEPLAVQLLEDYIAQSGSLRLAFKCYHAMDALRFLKQQPVDLIFMDINMPKLTGMELASLLSPEQKIIFTTAYSEYAVQSYEKNAIDYLLKPITFDRFLKAVSKVEKLVDTKADEKELSKDMEGKAVFVKSGKSIVKISIDDILFVEGLKDYVCIHTQSEKLVAYKRMKDLEETLPTHFMRIHNSYIVNLDRVSRFEENHLFLGQERIPISDKYRDQFLRQINRRLL